MGAFVFCVSAGAVALGAGCTLIGGGSDLAVLEDKPATGARGILEGYYNGRVSGWAFIADQVEPVRVSIEVDGFEVGVADADDPRSDLLDKGIHPTRNAGFHLDIQVDSGSTIEAFLNPEGLNWELDGSPLMVP